MTTLPISQYSRQQSVQSTAPRLRLNRLRRRNLPLALPYSRCSMRFHLRFASRMAVPTVILPVLSMMLALPSARAATGDDILLDQQAIAQLEARAAQANPREQCFLYTELVHHMTEVAAHQMNEGDTQHASATLKRVEHYARLIHMGLAKDTKRLKNAEMLMHKTTYRLTGFLHSASDEDKATLQATLKQLDTVQEELLDQVFSH